MLGVECSGAENIARESGIHFRMRIGLQWSEVDLVSGEAGGGVADGEAGSSRLKMTRGSLMNGDSRA